MERKRKVPPNSSQSTQLEEQSPLKLPHQQQQPQHDREEEYEEVEEEVEEEEEEDEDEVEEEEDDDEDAEEDKDNIPDHDQTAKVPSTSSAPVDDDDDDDDDPIQKLLEPLGKDQIASLLCEAATNHRDVADRIRNAANADPAHRKIFVHGLGWDTTTETLAANFRQYGEIEDCKAVTDKVSGKSKGYGFILFKTRRGALKALQQPQKKIGNRMTACQLASIGSVQQQPNNNNNSAASSMGLVVAPEFTQRKIYVSNVGPELDPKKLLTFFSRFGEIEEGPLGLDKVTGKPKGFCLFVYKSAESAKRALEESHKQFEGHILHCQRAIDGPKQGKSQQQQHQRMVATTTAGMMQFPRNSNSGFVGNAVAPAHLMAPAGPAVGFNQGAAVAAQVLDPALGQALTALLASQGTGLGLTGLLGTLGLPTAVNPAVPAAGHGMQVGYNRQANVNPGIVGGYGNQVGLQGAYPNQQVGQGGSGRGQQQQQHGVGQYGGVAPYMGQ